MAKLVQRRGHFKKTGVMETEDEKTEKRLVSTDSGGRKGFFAARGGPRKVLCAKFVDKTEFVKPKQEEKPKSKLAQMFSDLAEIKKRKVFETPNKDGYFTID